MQYFRAAEVTGRVKALVEDLLQQKALPTNIAANAHLADIGLSSMDMVNLMLVIEAEFDFTIPHADITPETFKTIESVAMMVVRQIPQDVAA